MTQLRTALLTTAIATALALPTLADGRGQGFLTQWDSDGDARVTLAEAIQHRTDSFTAFDADESGTLDAAELAEMDATSTEMRETMQGGRSPGMTAHGGAQQGKRMGQHGGQGRMGPEHRQGDHARLDANGDGLVTLAEFTDATADWFQRRDGNADGVISSDDFGPRF